MSAREAGREMDAEIAEKVMGLRCVDDPPGSGRNCPVHSCDFYSTDIAAAMEVVESDRWYVRIEWDADGVWHVQIGAKDFDVAHRSLPLAICRALLAFRAASHPTEEGQP